MKAAHFPIDSDLRRACLVREEDDIVATCVDFVQQTEDDIKALAQLRSAASPGLNHTEIQESSAFGDPGYCAGGLLHAIPGVYIEWFIVIAGEAGSLEGLHLCKQVLGLIVVRKQTVRLEVRFDQFVKCGRRLSAAG